MQCKSQVTDGFVVEHPAHMQRVFVLSLADAQAFLHATTGDNRNL